MASMPSASRVTQARPDELATLAAMRHAEGWVVNRWLLDLLCQWPQARIGVVRDATTTTEHNSGHGSGTPRLLGTTVATAYGPLGFIGNVVVDPAARGRGYGKLLMRDAIAWLRGRGVRTVLLDATEDGRPLYRSLGFVGTTHSWVVWQPLADIALADGPLPAGTTVTSLAPARIARIGMLDRAAFGGDRMGLLAAMLALPKTHGYVAEDAGGAVAGYLIARPLEAPRAGIYLGPVVARSPEAARALVMAAARHAREREPHATTGAASICVAVPGSGTLAVEAYRSLGLNVLEDDLRMRLDLAPDGTGTPPHVERQAGQAEWAYGMLSPMVG